LPAELGLPLSRFSREELRRQVLAQGIVAQISGTTIWRWLRQDALRPWSKKCWVFPRAPDFAERAGRVLDLYHRQWEGLPLGAEDFVLSADEKSQLQMRRRFHPTQAPRPGRPLRFEERYRRCGTCVYYAAWDVQRARLFGHVVDRGTIVTFDAFVAQVMATEPYCSAQRVFWVVDNGTIHRGQRACDRLRAQWPNLILVHLPVHASWLNQIEIYFSILQRKALTPDDFDSREALETRIYGFQEHYEQIAEPFNWCFTRDDLRGLLARWTEDGLRRAA
jgi:hypothetical protein